MRQLVRAACFIALPLAMITPASAAAEFTAKDLAAEEGKFAAFSVKNGMRAAFLEFFADQSWLLRPDPVDAKTWVGARPDPAIVLDWKSQIAILSASGDLGFSTGPSIYRIKSDLKAPAVHGEFFSVWQKQKSGEWKVLVDHGISHGPTATPDALPTTPLVALDLRAEAIAAAAPTDDAERQFLSPVAASPMRMSSPPAPGYCARASIPLTARQRSANTLSHRLGSGCGRCNYKVLLAPTISLMRLAVTPGNRRTGGHEWGSTSAFGCEMRAVRQPSAGHSHLNC